MGLLFCEEGQVEEEGGIERFRRGYVGMESGISISKSLIMMFKIAFDGIWYKILY